MSEYFEKLEMDRKQGDEKEQEVKKLLENILGCELFKTKKYDPFDFLDNNERYYEVKSRSCSSEEWGTTIVSTVKVLYASKNPRKQFYFIFAFSDCIKYIKYDPEVFSYFSSVKKTRTDRGKNEVCAYTTIPVHFLRNLEEIILE